MADAHYIFVCKMKSSTSCLFFVLFLSFFFRLDDQPSAPILHKSRTFLHSKPTEIASNYLASDQVLVVFINKSATSLRMRIACPFKYAKGGCIVSLELNGNTCPSSSQGSNHSDVVRLSESLGSNSTSAVSQGIATIRQRKRLPRHLQCTRAKKYVSFDFFRLLYFVSGCIIMMRTSQTYVLFFRCVPYMGLITYFLS
jgi:hypothetical protein